MRSSVNCEALRAASLDRVAGTLRTNVSDVAWYDGGTISA